nr:reverse transcriptase domain-containing protein [Tanacetum cinerariifolium]
FFKTLKKCTKKSDFQWTTKAKSAFKQMKRLIVELPTLTAPIEKKELIVYLAAIRESMSAVLMTKREANHMPIYFVSHALQVIPAEIGMPTLRIEIDMVQNDKALKLNLDLFEEKREQAARRKAKMEKYYNFKVRNTNFKLGDLVYHNNDASHAQDEGKLGHKWEGPYEVIEALGKGAYKLKDRKGKLLLRI